MEHEEQHKESSKTSRTGKTRGCWRAEVERWRSSGLTQKEFCSKEGLSLERFGTWKRRLEREDNSGALVAVPTGIVSSALHTSQRMLSVVVAERYRIEIPDAFTPNTLQNVLEVLSRL